MYASMSYGSLPYESTLSVSSLPPNRSQLCHRPLHCLYLRRPPFHFSDQALYQTVPLHRTHIIRSSPQRCHWDTYWDYFRHYTTLCWRPKHDEHWLLIFYVSLLRVVLPLWKNIGWKLFSRRCLIWVPHLCCMWLGLRGGTGQLVLVMHMLWTVPCTIRFKYAFTNI